MEFKHPKYTSIEAFEIVNAEKKPLGLRINARVIKEIDKHYKAGGWASRAQLIEHLLCMWLFDPELAKLVADSRDLNKED
jgi:hypothetical protein